MLSFDDVVESVKKPASGLQAKRADVKVIVNSWNRNIIPWWLLLPEGASGEERFFGAAISFTSIDETWDLSKPTQDDINEVVELTRLIREVRDLASQPDRYNIIEIVDLSRLINQLASQPWNERNDRFWPNRSAPI